MVFILSVFVYLRGKIIKGPRVTVTQPAVSEI